MKRYLWRRAGGFLLTALVNFATFSSCRCCLVIRPCSCWAPRAARAYAALRRELSLDKPVLRYGQWLLRFIGGQWGTPGAIPCLCGSW